MVLLLACSAPYDLPSAVPAPEPWGRGSGASAAVVINEVQANNDSTLLASDLSFPDWVELYNTSDEPVDIADLSLTDSSGDTWEGGTGELPPGGWLLLLAGGDSPGAGELPFSLDADGEELTLSWHGQVLDQVSTGETASDASFARYPDGGTWATTARPTPGWTNGNHAGDSVDPSDYLFDPLTVHPLDLWVEAEQWAALEADNYTEVQASLAFGPAWFSRVGFRKKATVGSNRTLDQKAAFKVDLNAYDDHEIRGQEMLTLNNMVQDPTYVAEHLSYAVFRASGVPAPRVGYVRLSINGEDWGLYALVESVDDAFLERWYEDASGALYEGAYGVDVQSDEIASFEYDEGPNSKDRSDLQAVAAVLAGSADDAGMAALEALVDMDEFLANMAVETLTLHWDGYTTANNYRLYHDPATGRFQIIPWGTDQTFITRYYGPYQGGGLLLTFCLQNASCYARYTDALRDAADVMDSLDLLAEMVAVHAALAIDIGTDPRAEYGLDTQASYLATMQSNIESWPDEVRAQLPASQ